MNMLTAYKERKKDDKERRTYQKQEIFRLQVTMRHMTLVTVLNGLKENPGHITGFLFIVVTLLNNPIKEFSSHHLFRNKIVEILLLKDIIETNNVWMLEFRQAGNLILERHFVFFRQLGLGDNLNGKGFTRLLIPTLLDDGKCTGTEL
jgi:hypothetical protein